MKQFFSKERMDRWNDKENPNKIDDQKTRYKAFYQAYLDRFLVATYTSKSTAETPSLLFLHMQTSSLSESSST